MNSRGAGSTSSTGCTLALGGTASGVLVSDISAPGGLSAGIRPGRRSVFRIVEYYFRITDKLTPRPREVKGEAGNEQEAAGGPADHPRAGPGGPRHPGKQG